MCKSKSAARRRYDLIRDVTLGSPTKFANRIASVKRTRFAEHFKTNPTLCTNPALVASSYADVDDFRHDYLLYNLLRKYNAADKQSGKQRASAAFSKFLADDLALSCVEPRLHPATILSKSGLLSRVLMTAKKKIARRLGSLDLHQLAEYAAFSGGATALHTRAEGHPAFKHGFPCPEVTPACAKLADSFIRLSASWSSNTRSFRLVEHNRLTTVPKSTDIDRVIACEPTMNLYIQKAIGLHIRKRLKRVGIDLNDQTINMNLARLGSITGDTATIDLAAASDSISNALCTFLIPEEWLTLLNTIRCDHGLMPDGSTVTYRKISSMGNGFTFELESLIFWALVQSCEDEISRKYGVDTYRCSVYGDDIICRTRSVKLVTGVLDYCGFATNVEKSFWSGPFRESCGGHYFNGIDVSPFFVRGPIEGLPSCFVILNGLRRWATTDGLIDVRYEPIYRRYVRMLPVKWQRARIPDGIGDGALIGSFDEIVPRFNKYGAYTTTVVVQTIARAMPTDDDYEYLHAVYYGLGGYLHNLSIMDKRAAHDGKLCVNINCALCAHSFDRDSAQSVRSARDGGIVLTVDVVARPGRDTVRLQSLTVYRWMGAA